MRVPVHGLQTMEGSKFVSNINHIARFECKPYPVLQPANAVTLAFEKFAYEKIVSSLVWGAPM